MSGHSPQVDLRSPLKRARGLGSAKSGVGHWWRQRATAALLVLLVPWLVGVLVSLVGADHATAAHLVARPFNAITLAILVIAAFWHAKLGMQVVIEDYVHTRLSEVFLQLLVTFACAFGAMASLYAIAKVALTATP